MEGNRSTQFSLCDYQQTEAAHWSQAGPGRECVYIFIFSLHSNQNAKSPPREDLLQPFSSEASAQSMTWLHQAEAVTQLPSLQDDSDGPHVTSAGERGIRISKRKLGGGGAPLSQR